MTAKRQVFAVRDQGPGLVDDLGVVFYCGDRSGGPSVTGKSDNPHGFEEITQATNLARTGKEAQDGSFAMDGDSGCFGCGF